MCQCKVIRVTSADFISQKAPYFDHNNEYEKLDHYYLTQYLSFYLFTKPYTPDLKQRMIT